nr:MAG TPA: hypothetical protein [Caudoviricetes sp.]
MKVKELKPILEHLDDDIEVEFTILTKKEPEVFFTLEDDSYDESFWT